MRKLLASLLFVSCISISAQNLPAFVQGISTPAGNGGSTLAYSSNVTAGNALYAAVYWGGGAGGTLTFTDSQSNAWTTSASGSLQTDQDTIAVGCAVAGSSGPNTVTFLVNGSSNSANIRGVLYEVKNGTCTQDVTAVFSNTQAQTSCNSGGLTTTTANDLLIGLCGLGSSQTALSAGSGWSSGTTYNASTGIAGIAELQVATTAGSYTATSGTYGTAAEQGTLEVAFKAYKYTLPAAGIIATLAGNGYYGYTGDGGLATRATFAAVRGAAVDGSGNVYIADAGNNVIRKVSASTGYLTTIAGNGTGGYSGDGGPATSAELSWPLGITVDAAGDIYFADQGNAVVRKISPSGIITTVAGNGNWWYTGDGGPATSASLSYDTNVAVDSAGNLYIADKYNMRIRKVWAATGIITTIAGNGTAGYTGDGGQATSAELNWPFGVAVDAVGNVYIADLNNNVVRKVTASTGTITTVAGNGTAGYSGDGGAATSAKLNGPYDVAVDAAGNLFISDSGNNVIRKVAAGTGTISTVAGNGTNGFVGDGGPATSAELSSPWDLATDPQGNIYLADEGNYRLRAVGSTITEPNTTTPKITWSAPAAIPYGTVLGGGQLNATTNVPGTFTYTPAAGTVLQAGLYSLSVLFTPNDTTHYSPVMATVPLSVSQLTPIITWANPAPIVYGTALSATQLNATANAPGTFSYSPASGSVLLPGPQALTATFTPTDAVDYSSVVATVILTVSGTPGPGIITTIAGNGYYGNTGDGGPAISAELEAPEGVAVDSTGNIYIPDTYSNVVRKVWASTGQITTIAGTGTAGYSGDGGQAISAKLNGPVAIAIDAAGNVYIADFQNNRIRKITVSTGVITTVAGTGTSGYSGDGGPATSAQICQPSGLAFDGSGNLYIADGANNAIRKVTTSTGIITTVVGSLNEPGGIAFDSAGNLYIPEYGNNDVRKLTASGTISTVAGNGTAGYSGDGGPATSAKLNGPLAVAVDAAGNLFIADYSNHVVRLVSAATSKISTVAGNGTGGFSGDGGPATSAQLNNPHGVALDSAGNLYIGDYGNHRVRLVGNAAQAQVSLSVSPASATLYGGQTKQFTATVNNTSNTAVTWSISPSGLGAINASGLYTAPATISSQQTVTVKATSQADSTKSASATVTLMPTISVSVSPNPVTLTASQSQTFTANVTNTTNTAVTWSISPSGMGTITSGGVYTAPSSITIAQTVTITATSQADTTRSGSATLYLVGSCASNGYSYVRSIVIDHTKVPNTDQTNFPFLFSTTDPTLKSVANGGHVTNANGYDIIFSADPNGITKLDHELEEYSPATGQVIAWVRIPTLSHTTDTTLYVFYGNSNISTSQANPTGVWDTNYKGVWHVANGTVLSTADSTASGNNGVDHGAIAANGLIDGAASFNGSSYIDVGNLGNFPTQGTIDFWMKASSLSSNPNAFSTNYNGGNNAVRFEEDAAGDFSVGIGNGSFNGYSFMTQSMQANTWYHVALTWNTSASRVSGYLNGAQVFGSVSSNLWPATIQDLAIGSGYSTGRNWNGLIDETRLSTTARSGDWIATEFNNQSSPSTFYTLGNESAFAISPATVSLYANQAQQFSTCTSVNWSIPAGAPGTISVGGLYTAPSNITAVQRVAVTATNATDPSKTGSAQVTLLPPQSLSLSLAASAPSPYVTGTTQQLVATLTNQDGTPLSGATVTFNVTGANATSGTSTTVANGTAIFSYTGAHSGSDTIQALTSVASAQATSNSVAVNWVAPVQQISTTTVTGQFFLSDGSGSFDTPTTAIPAFTQVFPTINFNPPAGTVPGNTSSVNVNTRPFTDVTTDLNGNFTGTIVAEGNGYQAGAGAMNTFQAVFRGEFTVAGPGNVTFNFFTDDGFILGIGNGATRVSGAATNMPSVTPFAQYPAMGAYNSSTSPVGNQVVVNFPSAGKYPYEVDYTECCNGQLVLTMTQGASSPTGVAPTGSLTISPGSLPSLPVGGQQSFTILASDAAGNPVPNTNVSLVVTGVDNLQLSGTTDSTGHVTIVYKDLNPGTAAVQAVAFIGGMVTYSNQVTVPWTASPSTGTGSGTSGTLNVSISAPNTLILPGTLPLSGSASDSALPQGQTISYAWSQVSGPGSVTFAPNAQQASPTASFIQPGSYQLKLTASDVNASASAQITVAVNPQPGISQGWIGSPAYGAAVSGIVPITVASGETLTSGVLTVYPANNPNAVTTLNYHTTGSPGAQIGTWDTTQVPNGTYWITLQAIDSTGRSAYNLALVTVVGGFKPGRVTSTVTDLVVPANGLPINIQRTYDSLNAGTSGDFGYGWNLGTTVNLAIDPMGNVTFTLGGIRRTFYLTPQYLGWLFPYYVPAYTPEPGFHGTLLPNGAGCPGVFSFLIPDGSLWACIGGGYYNPTSFIYTDTTGTMYLISAGGNLYSILDKNGNRLDFTANGITSSTGLSVPFVRDSSGRITKITDPQNNQYLYGYDSNGNLVSVTYPNTAVSTTYTYVSGTHYYQSGTDFNNNPLPSTAYYQSTFDANGNCVTGCDPNGVPLNNRLKSVTDGLGETTSYAYNLKVALCPATPNNNLVTSTTTITYPQDASGVVGTATMKYNCAGDVVSSVDPLNLTTTNAYDINRNLLSVTKPLGDVTSYAYDANGNRTSVTYPATATSHNTTSTTAYNKYSEPTQTIDELGNVRAFNYDVYFNPQNVTDSLGTLASFAFNTNGTMQLGAVGYDIGVQPSMASRFAYDSNGNLTSRIDALGRTTTYTYDSLGHKLSMTEPPPNSNTSAGAGTTNYTYDPFGNLTQTAAPLGRTTSSVYDGNGNKTSDTDARSYVTRYKYDALNRLVETDYPDSTSAKKTYDFRGNVVTETDQAGNVTKNVYDPAGRLTSVTRAYGTSNATTTSYAYDNDGRKQTETDALNHTTSYTYDAASNLTKVSGVNGTFTYGYDDVRNRISVTDGNSNKTSYVYDPRKRLVETDYPDSTKTTNSYDGPGNLISVTDQNGNQVQYTYDAANQLASVTQTASPNIDANTTVVGYDADGNPIAVEDANAHTTATSFDLLGQVTGKTLPDGNHTETRSYDEAGNLLSLTHFNGVTTTYTYDSLNRLLSRSTPNQATVSFTYTATGKRHTMTDASGAGATTYNYDSMDRLSSKQTPEGTLTYTYDPAGHLASMVSSNPGGANINYTYDSLNRLSTVVDNRLPSGSSTTTYTYDTANNVATVTYPNGVQTQFQYDSLNRVKALATATTGYSYVRDATGKLSNVLESGNRSVTWNYDGINRLSGETITNAQSGKNGTAGYGLDPVGNRLSEASTIAGLNPGSFAYNTDDELSSETYDANGNVTSTGGRTFAYDSENHLIAMGSTVSLVYDGDGNRAAKTVNGVVTRYLVDDLNPTGYPQVVEELNGTGAVQRVYTYGSQRISEYQPISGTWTASFYGYDGGGNVRQLTNSPGGGVTDTYEYDAFGNLLNKTGSTPNNYLYRGEQYDPDLGLYYLRARYLNPLTGRFMSRDPENGQSTDPISQHKYLYANGDPINGWDPTGKEDAAAVVQLDFRAIGAVVGLTAEAAAITCVLDLAASELAATVNQYQIVGIDLPSCTAKTDRCAELLKEIYRYMNTISKRIDDLLTDRCDLYNLAYDVQNPSLSDGCEGTWVGHQEQVLGWQEGLRRKLKEAERKGCPIPPGAWALATRPIPNQPRGN